jgi:hypothetical protein
MVARRGACAREQGGRILYARGLLRGLERRELAQVGAGIANETGLSYAETTRRPAKRDRVPSP